LGVSLVILVYYKVRLAVHFVDLLLKCISLSMLTNFGLIFCYFILRLKIRDRHIRSTTVELQALLKQMAMTLIKQMEASVTEVQSLIKSQITSLASDASKAKKVQDLVIYNVCIMYRDWRCL